MKSKFYTEEEQVVFETTEVSPFLFQTEEQNRFKFLTEEQGAFVFTSEEIEGDIIAPSIISAVLTNAFTLVLTFDENLDTGSVPDVIDFVYNYTLSNPVINGDTLTFTLTSPAQIISQSISYLPGTNPLQDASGNKVSAFTQSVSTSGLINPPVLSTAILTNANTLELTFDSLLDSTLPDNIDFVLTWSAGSVSVSNRSISSYKLTLTSDKYIQYGNTLSVAYIQGTNKLQGLFDNYVPSFSSSVNVSALVAPPVISTIEVGTVSGYSWNVVFDKAIANTMPAASSFAVTGFTFASISKVGSNQVEVISNELAIYGASYTMTYTQPLTNPLQGVDNNYVVTQSKVVSNNMPIPGPNGNAENLTVTVISDVQLNLAWTYSGSDHPSFSIERKLTSGGSWAEIFVTSADATSYNNTGLTSCSEYYYRVRAILGGIYTNYSNEASNTSYLWYGVSINEANSSPDLTRIAGGSYMPLHATLPVHALMKGCLLSDAGVVNYYLKSDDWSKKADGSASVLDGTDGQVMVEVGPYYRLAENPSSGVYTKKISLLPIAGFELIPKFYVGFSHAAIQRSTLKLASVINLTTDYRGGNNTSAWDAGNNTLLGKSATSISLTNFRTYARNRNIANKKWNVYTWRLSMLVYELYMIEFATLNSQKAVNGTLTVDGYKQGGLGAGVSTVTAGTWNTFNSYNPIIPCGQSNSLANGSGEVAYTIPGFGDASGAVKIARYRGIENPFGHIWDWRDGSTIFHQTVVQGNKSLMYTCDDPNNFTDGAASLTNYELRAEIAINDGYIKTMHHDAKAILAPKVTTGGGATTYFADYYYQPGRSGSWVALFGGCDANSGAYDGFVSLFTNYAASNLRTYIGARLCFIP